MNRTLANTLQLRSFKSLIHIMYLSWMEILLTFVLKQGLKWLKTLLEQAFIGPSLQKKISFNSGTGF